jgi:hypothetical protein
MFSADLDVFFAGPDAVDVVFGESTFKGLLDQPDESVGTFHVSTEYILTAKTSDVATVEQDNEITVDGSTYEVRQKRKIDDGALTKLLLSKV